LNQKTTMTTDVKIGDLVRISTKVHQQGIPKDRTGLVIKRLETVIDYMDTTKQPTDVWLVQFTNGKIMKFHDMWIEIIRSA